MNVTVTKAPDGVAYMTQDGHGELFNADVKVDAKPSTFGDCTVELAVVPSKYANEPDQTVVRFSYVDYLDTANRDQPGKGVRQRLESPVPTMFGAGPYTVTVAE